MSREAILDHLSARDISIVQLVYSQQHISVYEGRYKNYPAAIKVQHSDVSSNPSELEKEFQTMLQLSHVNILKLYDCFWVAKNTDSYLVFASEWCVKDLQKDVTQRKANQYPWKEDDLWKVIHDLVAAFAYMQRQGLAHRDIKPANVFMGTNREIKVGDFGSATSLTEGMMSVVGTPLYCSPELKKALLRQSHCVKHDPFKSDVYSLGLTLYELASLQPPTDFFAPTLTQETTEQIVESLSYSANLKSLIKSMLIIDEEKRGDFLQFEAWMNPIKLSPSSISTGPITFPTDISFDPMESPKNGELPSASGLSATHKSPIQLPPAIPAAPASDNVKVSEPAAQYLQTKSEPMCMHCFKEVDRCADNAEFEVVQLTCNPRCHMFCSRTCFVSWGLQQPKSHPHCPECGEPIEPDVFQDYQINEETEADEEKKELSASCCRKSDATFLEENKKSRSHSGNHSKSLTSEERRDMVRVSATPADSITVNQIDIGPRQEELGFFSWLLSLCNYTNRGNPNTQPSSDS